MFGKKKGSDTEDKEVKKAKKEKKPKREKKPKEPKQKKEKKPKRERKPKEPKKPRPPKKPKPPKRPRPKKPKKPKKKMNPLILVIILLALMVVAAAGALVMMMKQREKEEDEMYGPMFYFTEEDAIESIRSKIGDREIKGGYQPPIDLTAETPTPEEESEEDKEDKDKKEDQKDNKEKEKEEEKEEEDKEKEEDPELAEVKVKLLTDQHLSYITPGDGIKEAEEYITYLVQEKGFKILTYPKGAEGEIPKEAPQPTQAEEDKEDEKEDSAEEEGFTPPEEGYYIAALDDKATAEEGEATELKRVRMEYTYDSYTLRLSTANGVVSDLIPPEPEEEAGPKEVTLSDAVVTLQGMASGILQLPKPTAEYEMTPIQGRVVLEGIDFYCVRAYEEGPEDTLIYGGSYYVSNDGGSIYKHDEMTGKITCIAGEDILAQARKQNKKKKVNENAAVLSGNQ